MNEITLVELRKMDDQQVRDLNHKLAKELLKKYSIHLGVTLVALAAGVVISNRLEKKFANENASE